MDTTLLDKLRPLLSRVLGAAIMWLLLKACAWLGVPLPDGLADLATELAVGLVLYALAHRLVDKRVNPGDAASATLAKVERRERAALRARAEG